MLDTQDVPHVEQDEQQDRESDQQQGRDQSDTGGPRVLSAMRQ